MLESACPEGASVHLLMAYDADFEIVPDRVPEFAFPAIKKPRNSRGFSLTPGSAYCCTVNVKFRFRIVLPWVATTVMV
jgi:hypothetical protein